MRYPKRSFCATDVRRTVEVRPTTPDRSRTAVDDAIRWFNAFEFRQLTLHFVATHDDDLDEYWRGALALVDHARTTKAPEKSDPHVCFAVPADRLTGDALDAIEPIDTRVPRILLLAECAAGDGRDFRADVERLASTLRERPLARRLLLTAHSAAGVDRLHARIAELRAAPDALAGFALGAFPVVEVPLSCADDEPEPLAAAIQRLWCACPELNESVALSPGGLLKHFFTVREQWYLGEVLNGSAPSNGRTDAPGDPALARFERAVRAGLNHDDYQRMTEEKKSAVLEHDVDLLSDSHECQSPVFVNNRWLLNTQRRVWG